MARSPRASVLQAGGRPGAVPADVHGLIVDAELVRLSAAKNPMAVQHSVAVASFFAGAQTGGQIRQLVLNLAELFGPLMGGGLNVQGFKELCALLFVALHLEKLKADAGGRAAFSAACTHPSSTVSTDGDESAVGCWPTSPRP